MIAIGGGVYIYTQNKNKSIDIQLSSDTSVNTQINSTSSNPSAIKSDVTFSISGDNLNVINNGKVTQTLSLDEQGVFAVKINPSDPASAFVLNKDVNFDGHNDVAVLASTGYAGVNYFYDYYIYNPKTERLEKSSVLTQLSNPNFDNANKKIISSYKSGPQWYTETFQWNGSTYIRSEAVAQ